MRRLAARYVPWGCPKQSCRTPEGWTSAMSVSQTVVRGTLGQNDVLMSAQSRLAPDFNSHTAVKREIA